MEDCRTTHTYQTAQILPPRAQTFTSPILFDWHFICAYFRHSLGDVTAGNGLWLRHDLLATITRLAESRRLAENPRDSAGQAAKRRPDRLWTLCRRQCYHPCGRGGEKTGPSPVDRRKPGSKHHVLTDGNGIPIVAKTTAANRHVVTQLLDLVNNVPAIAGKPGPPCYRFAELYADRAYDSEPDREALREVGIEPHIAKRYTEHGSGLGVFRWVVERTFSWLHQFRRLRVRYERRADIHQAFLIIGCIIICHRIYRNSFC